MNDTETKVLESDFFEAFQWGTEDVPVPDMKIPPEIDKEELRKALGVDEITTITLPISKIPAESRNKRIYNENAVRGIVEQVKRLRVEGNWGHGGFFGGGDERPAIRWLDAMVDENTKVAWGLAVPLNEETRKYYETAKAAKAQVGTSLFSMGFRWEIDPITAADQNVLPVVNSVDLARIDIVNPMMVGVPAATSSPTIRKEDVGDIDVSTAPGTTPTPPQAPPVVPVNRDSTALAAALEKIEDLEPKIKERAEACTLLGIKEEESLPLAIRRLQSQMNGIKSENVNLLETHIDKLIEDSVKIKELRPMIKRLVVNTPTPPSTKAEADNSVAAVLELEDVKIMLKSGLAASMGEKHAPPAGRNQDETEQESFLEEKPK